MKRFFALLFALAFLGSISPTLISSARAAEPIDVTSAALKHEVSQSTTSTQLATSSISQRYWVNYGDLPRTTLGRVNTAAIANWSISLPNDDREYLYNPSTRQLTALDDLASEGKMPALLVEMLTNTNSTSVRVCRQGLRLLGLTALRCRESTLADLPIRHTASSQDVVTSSSRTSTTPEVSTSSSSTDNQRVTTTQTTTNNSVSAPIDVALRSVDSSIPSVGDRIGSLVITQTWNSRHMGMDLALPQQGGRWPDSTGIPVYAIGAPGTKVEVRCWSEPIAGLNASTYAEGMDFAFDFAHLDSCIAGERGTAVVNAGDRIGTIGNTGSATTGPHLHMQQRRNGTANPVTGEHVEAWRGYIEIAVSGLGTNNVASNR